MQHSLFLLRGRAPPAAFGAAKGLPRSRNSPAGVKKEKEIP